ncbi:MAG: 2,3-bisphosphoglycerate-independent phosphoglycerate mutase [Patescibacteria group bacterium]|nr:2,3-bisphosphoglycerate-independent phosphoglycerate mutase [Patescibacteria group bacterium]
MTDRRPKPVALIILDGWGHRPDNSHNAIAQARTPFFDELTQKYPHTLLNASEQHVGLPAGQIGNSEIGHMTIGTGRIIHTDLVKIDKAAKDNLFAANPAFSQLFDHVKQYDSTLHVLGLVSPGGIHSHRDHLYAFLKAAKASGITKLAIHAFTDGRDVPPKSAAGYLRELESVLKNLGIGFIASVSGRFYAMDRDKNWDRIKKAEDAIFHARGAARRGQMPSEILAQLYGQGVIDELLEPLVFLDDTGRGFPVAQNDGMFFFNYRPDRARQLSQKILDLKRSHNLCFVTMTEYDKSFEALVAFPDQGIDDSLASVLALADLKQSHIAETEKYPHVTYFFNGGREEPHQNEHHFLIKSRKDIKTHDQAPQMRAAEIADKALERITAGDDFLVINFANADMVGHTANVPAIVTAVETVDSQLKRVVEAVLRAGGTAIVTADHGNAEVNVDKTTGEKHTAHTLNLVPFILAAANPKIYALSPQPTPGTLADIAPTILKIMNLPKPASMTGKNLIA